MHKQQRYLLILMLAKAVSDAKAMDLAKIKPSEQHLTIIDEITAMSASKYQAKQLEQQAQVHANPQELFDVSGTPGELVARIHLLEKQMKEETARLQPLYAQQTILKTGLTQRSVQLAALLKQIKLHELEDTKLKSKKLKYVTQETDIVFKEKAVARLVEASAQFAKENPLLATVPNELLIPILQSDLKAQKKQLALKIGEISVLWKAVNKKINPLMTQQKVLAAEQEKYSTALRELEQSIYQSNASCSRAEAEKDQLFASLESQLEFTVQSKQKQQDKVQALRMAITEETVAATKLELRTELIGIEREIAAYAPKISALEKAIAQAKGTTGLLGWLIGN